MVFQKSNRFPKSIYENIAYTFRIAGIRDGRMIDETVEDSLRRAALPVGDLIHAKQALEMHARLLFYHADIVMIKLGLETIQSQFASLGFAFDNRLNG